MLPWLDILYHAFWVAGLAALLATLSLADWSCQESKHPLWDGLAKPSVRFVIALSLALFAAGLMLGAAPVWHKVIWTGLFLLALWESGLAWQRWLRS